MNSILSSAITSTFSWSITFEPEILSDDSSPEYPVGTRLRPLPGISSIPL